MRIYIITLLCFGLFSCASQKKNAYLQTKDIITHRDYEREKTVALGLERIGQIDAAHEVYNGLLEQDHKLSVEQKSELHLLKGTLYRKDGKVDKAIAEYDAAYNHLPTNLNGYKNKAKLLVINERYEDFDAELDKILKINPNDPYGLSHKVYLYFHVYKNIPEAEKYLNKIDPSAGLYNFIKGHIALEKNDNAKAIEHFKTSIAQENRLVDTQMALARAYYQLGDPKSIQKAQIYIARAFEKSIFKKTRLKNQGIVQIIHGETKDGCKSFKNSMKMRKGQTYPAYHLIDLQNTFCR